MEEVSLRTLLEKGSHFGHKVSRWHPKAKPYIYEAKDGIHIIDLSKTKMGLVAAALFVHKLGEEGKTFVMLGTKRQARAVISAIAQKEGIFYFTQHWVGGFITNWEEIKKNVMKIRKMRKDKKEGGWKIYPKHEIVKMDKELKKLELVYGGVVELENVPDALFIIDLKKEGSAVKEATRRGVKVVAIVDTNTDPTPVDFPIPANDDAVGSIEYISDYIARSYVEGRMIAEKKGLIVVKPPVKEVIEEVKDTKTQSFKDIKEEKKEEAKEDVKEASKTQSVKEEKKEEEKPVEKKKKAGKPKKIKN
ncbi:MAG: 30S ribosomal protein S2 [Candidatus Gottesmanbacteria bacterium GW2011_GWC2_39_8]|uniref:Small ribosomal subunit protein uS2 n=1 Tax=Candidatus Gottesmanbacteria bacterium GW2011_GWC2_39_8 TaxID=1618450 RepID=A0A0G0T1R0_9BACT|nr:MAG: 30S ribosomal protein S2 [Candidatus Gottesmanbacteria bacterium GW2011_GWC2_39_8]